MHCTSIYPTPYDKVRLGALQELKNKFKDSVVGLSDHSFGNYTCFASIPLGASILEKHFTSSKTWPGPDIPISIDPGELEDLIKGSLAIHKALGGAKNILVDEKPTIDFAYACVVAIQEIKKGDLISNENIWVKRPGTGQIKAKDFDALIGRTAKTHIEKNRQLKWEDLL